MMIITTAPLLAAAAVVCVVAICSALAAQAGVIAYTAVEMITNFLTGLAQGLEDHKEEIAEAIRSLFESFIDIGKEVLGIHSPSKEAEDIGDLFMQGLIDGLNGLVEKLKEKLKEVAGELPEKLREGVSDALGALGEKIEDFKEGGANLIAGIKQGIADKASELYEKVTSVASDTLQKFKDKLGIASPSKEFAKAGRFIDEGLIKGIASFASKVFAASEDVGQGTLDAMSDTLGGLADVIDSDMDMTPTITPVLNMDELQNGVNTIDGMFGATTIGLAAQASDLYNARANYQNEVMANSLYNDSKVISAINDLQNNFDMLNNAISNLRIQMDTGALVGQIVDPMNQALGRQLAMEGRRL
jgi:hypothetical protein